ncbi:MAG: M4 family metallopeptidase [Actinomycetes bacterium]
MRRSGRPKGVTAGATLLSVMVALTLAQPSYAAAGQAADVKTPAPADALSNSTASTSKFQLTPPGQPISRAAGVPASASPQTLARSFLASTRSQVGPSDANTELDLKSVQPSAAHGKVVRFQQRVSGIPVLGGEVLVDLDKSGNVRSAASESLPGAAPDSTAAIPPADASSTALAEVAKRTGTAQTSLRASKPQQWIFDPRIMGMAGVPKSALVWRTEVTSTSGPSVNRLVLVDAQTGSVTLDLNQIKNAEDRQICDANSSPDQVPCVAPVRTEGGPPSMVTDVNQAYDYSGDTYDFYYSRFGRDSLDNHGMSTLSTVRYCEAADACPLDNAFWDGSQMAYGEGYAGADDVVGHEMTHGVTTYMSDLIYQNQSGAINESLSDIFGEFVDLTNSGGTDTPAVRWLIGEDLPRIGTIRNMADPPAFGHPDRMGSPLYHTGHEDSGGIHSNSGVGNKFAYLLTDGGAFNGRTVTGLGLTKAPQIIYWAANLLTPASDYTAFGQALQASCASLVGTNGITEADCAQVEKAGQAVEIIPVRTAPLTPAVPAALAGNGQASVAWVAPPDGSSAITDYLVQYSSDGGSSWSTFPDGVSTTTSATVTGLTNGTGDVVRVAAKNLVGTGDYSPASATITPGTSAPSSYVANYAGDPIAVPDGDAAGAVGKVAVPAGIGPITKVTVTLGSIDMTYDQDLTISLISPADTEVALSTRNGSSGDNYVQTVFDDNAAEPITDGKAPFTSAFRPQGSLATLNGQSPTGTWRLKVVDDANGDVATINAFSVTIWGPTPQAITFTPPAGTSMSARTVAVSAFATSGLAVAFTTATPTVCSVTDATVTLLSAGTCTINADQPGNATWAPAPRVTRSFQVAAVVPPPTTPVMANQKRLAVKKTLRIGGSLAIRGRTSAGIPVLVQGWPARVCKVSRSANHWKVTGKRRGVCTLVITNPGTANWKPLIQGAQVRVK